MGNTRRIALGLIWLGTVPLAVGCGTAAEPKAVGLDLRPEDSYQVLIAPASGSESDAVAKEWVDPSDRRYRSEAEGATKIFTGTDYATQRDSSWYVKSGDAAYVARFADFAVSMVPVRVLVGLQDPPKGTELETADVGDDLKVDVFVDGKLEATMFIVREATPDETDRLGIFAVPTSQIHVGEAPTLPVKAFWFGPEVAGRAAVAATETTLVADGTANAPQPPPWSSAIAHITFYELPSAHGESSLMLRDNHDAAPDGEWQVTSQPVDSALAKRKVETFDGQNGDDKYDPWPRQTVTLADGESATVVPFRYEDTGDVRDGFAVITGDTLVSVSGRIPLADIFDVAAKLTPLGR